MPRPEAIYTVGHSNTGLKTFLGLLRAHGIHGVADVRSFPGSRRHPHFGREPLREGLAGEGIDYRWFPGLGGRRTPAPGSPHLGWREPGFRSYADYMETAEFAASLAEMLAWADGRRIALLCAERLWWQCHRRLLSDCLTVAGHGIRHILSSEKSEPHRLTEFLRLEEGRLLYDLVLPLDH